jgi:hypothetical protein
MLALLLESAARSVALGVAVWVGLKFLRVRNPHDEMTAWRVVLAASLAMPLLVQLMAPWATVTIPASAPLAQIVIPEAAKIDRAVPTISSQAPSPASRRYLKPASRPSASFGSINEASRFPFQPNSPTISTASRSSIAGSMIFGRNCFSSAGIVALK